jgi:protease IV
MAKFLLGVIVGVVVAVLGLIIIGFALGRLFSSKQPVIAPNAVLVLALTGDIPESSPVDLSFNLGQSGANPTVRDTWTSLRSAATDSKIKAVLLEPRGLTAGWAKLQELRRELLNFKKSGKPVYALLQGAGSREYYLSTAADRILLSPDDLLDVKGFRVEEMYFKNTLDKLGVGVQVDHVGRYKDAGDMFSRTGMTPETREVLNQILDQLFGDFCATVGAGRHKSTDDVKALIDMGPFTAQQAKAAGLVDELGYEDQVFSELKRKTGINDLNKVTLKTYFRATPGKGDRIALIVGEGDIIRSSSDDSTTNESIISSGSFNKIIRQVRNDNSIKGVILRVDSPGGDAVASDEILHELKLLSAAKPLVISMSDLAASGGYFISITGDQIFSYPNTITGSIGVLYVRPNFHNLYDKLGVQQEAITRGKLADLDSLYNPLSDAARQKLHDSIETTYRSFVTKVATARKKTYDQIDQLAQGRVWMGTQARENALVDELGGLDEAVASIRRKAKLSPTGDTNLVMFPPRRSLLDILINPSTADSEADAVVWKGIHTAVPGLPKSVLPSPAILKGGMLRIMPYKLSIQ